MSLDRAGNVIEGWGAKCERGPQGVRITVAVARKRELIERLWAAGCDVVSLVPVRSSLEDAYMQLIGPPGVPV